MERNEAEEVSAHVTSAIDYLHVKKKKKITAAATSEKLSNLM